MDSNVESANDGFIESKKVLVEYPHVKIIGYSGVSLVEVKDI